MTNHCLDSVASLYSMLKVSSVSVERQDAWGGRGGSATRIIFLVKNLGGASLDEAPLVEALEYAAARAGIIAEFVEYEPVEGGTSRVEKLSRFIGSLVEKGRAFAVLVPTMLLPALIGRLPESAIETLEAAAKLRVRVRHENLLYLPRSDVAKNIEIVGKLNSLASYRRVSVLQSKAMEEGLQVKRQVYLDSNREILDYILEAGSRGPLKRIPVTKLALVITGVYECRYPDDPPINKYIIEEEVDHTIIMVGTPERLEAEIEEAVGGVINWSPSAYEARNFASALSPYIDKLVRAIF